MVDEAKGGKPEEKGGKPEGGEKAPVNFDEWYKARPENERSLIDSHVSGLKSALDSERESAKTLRKQLKEIAATAEGDAKKQIEKINADLEATASKAAFYEAAHGAGVKNLKLAYIAAKDLQLIRSDGTCDMEKLKAECPELFAMKTTVDAGAGKGTGTPTGGGVSMNEWIRSQIK